ncbi:MAG: hypothetical protein CVT49_14180 [candidate division Zixibacteria bacterium HGW-Zixibacteria-1]|nr:MAG: hypothetical protein CVT49_14180 [candidate division Zixibacteria bacterium HGW-Zixibacteria-1]
MRWSRFWNKIVTESGKKNAPVKALSKAILDGSLAMAEEIRPSMEFNTKEESDNNWVYVLFEFQYLLFHLVSRYAAIHLGPEKRSDLLEDIAPLVIQPTLNAIFGHWPDDLKTKINSEYYENLAKSEYDYGTCKQVWSDEEVDDMNDVVIYRFAKNVANLMGNPHNPGLILDVQRTLIKGLNLIQFNTLLEKVYEVF